MGHLNMTRLGGVSPSLVWAFVPPKEHTTWRCDLPHSTGASRRYWSTKRDNEGDRCDTPSAILFEKILHNIGKYWAAKRMAQLALGTWVHRLPAMISGRTLRSAHPAKIVRSNFWGALFAWVLRGNTIRGNRTRNSERKMTLWEGLWESLWKPYFWKPPKNSEKLLNPPLSETLSEADFPLGTSQATLNKCKWRPQACPVSRKRFFCGNDTVVVAMRFAMQDGQICFSLWKFRFRLRFAVAMPWCTQSGKHLEIWWQSLQNSALCLLGALEKARLRKVHFLAIFQDGPATTTTIIF